MKRLFFLILLAIIGYAMLHAQNETYLHKRGNNYEVLDPNSVYHAQRIDITNKQRVNDYYDNSVPLIRYDFREYKTENCYRGFFYAGYDIPFKSADGGQVIILTTHGYQATQNLFIGVGVGLDIPVAKDIDHSPNIPIYGALRLQTNHHNVTPFVGCNVGYCIFRPFGDREELDTGGAFYLHPELGLNFVVGNNLGLNLSVGYTLYKYKQTIEYHEETYNRQGLSVTLGLEF